MTKGVLNLVLGLVLVGSVGAAEPRGVVIQVEAGAYERRDTPISFPVPAALKGPQMFTMESLDGQETIPAQRTLSLEPRIGAILKGTMPASSKRRYRIVPVADSTSNSGSPTSPRVSERNGLLTLELDGKPVLVYHKAVA